MALCYLEGLSDGSVSLTRYDHNTVDCRRNQDTLNMEDEGHMIRDSYT